MRVSSFHTSRKFSILILHIDIKEEKNAQYKSALNTDATCFITKTRLYNFDPLKPHFYIVKLGLTGVYIIFLISAQKHRLRVLVRTARRGGSNEYPQSMV